MASPSFNNLKKTLTRHTKVVTANGTYGKNWEWVVSGTVDVLIQPLGVEENADLTGGALSEAYKAYTPFSSVINENDRLIDGDITYEVKDIQENDYTQVPSFVHKKLFLQKLSDGDQY